MDNDEKQLMLTGAWLFARHGQSSRSRTLLEALGEEDPKDGVVASVLGQLLMEEGRAEEALKVVRGAYFPERLKRAEAILETRALRALGKADEADKRWRRYVNASQGAKREWVES